MTEAAAEGGRDELLRAALAVLQRPFEPEAIELRAPTTAAGWGRPSPWPGADATADELERVVRARLTRPTPARARLTTSCGGSESTARLFASLLDAVPRPAGSPGRSHTPHTPSQIYRSAEHATRCACGSHSLRAGGSPVGVARRAAARRAVAPVREDVGDRAGERAHRRRARVGPREALARRPPIRARRRNLDAVVDRAASGAGAPRGSTTEAASAAASGGVSPGCVRARALLSRFTSSHSCWYSATKMFRIASRPDSEYLRFDTTGDVSLTYPSRPASRRKPFTAGDSRCQPSRSIAMLLREGSGRAQRWWGGARGAGCGRTEVGSPASTRRPARRTPPQRGGEA